MFLFSLIVGALFFLCLTNCGRFLFTYCIHRVWSRFWCSVCRFYHMTRHLPPRQSLPSPHRTDGWKIQASYVIVEVRQIVCFSVTVFCQGLGALKFVEVCPIYEPQKITNQKQIQKYTNSQKVHPAWGACTNYDSSSTWQ